MFRPGELEQIKADEVKATWGMEDQIILNGTGGLVEMRGGGYYYETWKMKNDDWFLASLRLERTYQKTQPHGESSHVPREVFWTRIRLRCHLRQLQNRIP